jgi:peptidylprolyl isomerase
MSLREGDFILVDYSLYIKETNELIETTIESIAKEKGLYKEGEIYRPRLVIIGEGRYVKGFEEALMSSEIGVEKEVEVEPSKAYGERDPNKIKIFSLRELIRQNIVPEIGKVIQIGNAVGVVRSISGGRVVVDFNHPLAGKTLVFKYKIVKKIDDDVEKVKYLVLRRMRNLTEDKVIVRIFKEEAKVEIDTPEEVLYAEDLQLAKSLISGEIFKYVSGIKHVVFLDHFFKKE